MIVFNDCLIIFSLLFLIATLNAVVIIEIKDMFVFVLICAFCTTMYFLFLFLLSPIFTALLEFLFLVTIFASGVLQVFLDVSNF